MKFLVIISIFLIGFIFVNITPYAFAGVFDEPTLNVDDLVVEEYVSDLCCMITTMTFVGDDVLFLQKSDGQVRLIQNGILQTEPVLDVNVNSEGEKGMLGITSVGSSVYLYFTESEKDGGDALGNRIYKYTWDGEKLINPILLEELPSNVAHNGGAMVAGLDDQVYAVIGDTLRYALLQNKPIEWLVGTDIDFKDNGVILQLETEKPYFAMGIRNSFGLAIDPVTGNLWATENGDDDFDEINLVPEKFNSGWIVIMGPATEAELAELPGYQDYVYDDPEFTWEKVVAPTGLSFGAFHEIDEYDNSLFVGDCNTGNLYRFELNENRDGFEFPSTFLQDNMVNKNESMDEIVIGTGFGCVTDIERGPDGFLYVVSLSEGTIYRILPGNNTVDSVDSETTEDKIPEWVKNNARWWANDEIDDNTFVSGIQFLIKEDILKVSSDSNAESSSDEIPLWIKNNAKWWAEDAISETDFISGIEYLINHGIIRVNPTPDSDVNLPDEESAPVLLG